MPSVLGGLEMAFQKDEEEGNGIPFMPVMLLGLSCDQKVCLLQSCAPPCSFKHAKVCAVRPVPPRQYSNGDRHLQRHIIIAVLDLIQKLCRVRATMPCTPLADGQRTCSLHAHAHCMQIQTKLPLDTLLAMLRSGRSSSLRFQ